MKKNDWNTTNDESVKTRENIHKLVAEKAVKSVKTIYTIMHAVW